MITRNDKWMSKYLEAARLVFPQYDWHSEPTGTDGIFLFRGPSEALVCQIEIFHESQKRLSIQGALGFISAGTYGECEPVLAMKRLQEELTNSLSLSISYHARMLEGLQHIQKLHAAEPTLSSASNRPQTGPPSEPSPSLPQKT